MEDCKKLVQTLLWIFFLFAIFPLWELFIGPPQLERETRNRESPSQSPWDNLWSQGVDKVEDWV
jgi:hypothetical protein